MPRAGAGPEGGGGRGRNLELSRGTQRSHHGECGMDGRRGPIRARRHRPGRRSCQWGPRSGVGGTTLSGAQSPRHLPAATGARGAVRWTRGAEEEAREWGLKRLRPWAGRKRIPGRSWGRWSNGSVPGERSGPQLSHRSDGAKGVFADKPAPHQGLQLLHLKWELSRAVGLGWFRLARGLAIRWAEL